jgi:AraC-like DNA-binding protein
MQYREIQPIPQLRGLIECFWLLEGNPTAFSAPPERLLPDGCIEIILNVGERFRQMDAMGAGTLQPATFVVGQMTSPVLVAPTGRVQMLGIRFVPGGSLPFLAPPAQEFADRITPLDELAGDLARELRLYLDRESFDRPMLTRIESALARRAAGHRSVAPDLRSALHHFIANQGGFAVDDLANSLDITHRKLQRRFRNEIGIGPKLLSRILRFQQVFRAVESNAPDWTEIAIEAGYFDQAHLIRDFHQFAGQTPALLFKDLSHLTEQFTRKYRMSHFSNTPR